MPVQKQKLQMFSFPLTTGEKIWITLLAGLLKQPSERHTTHGYVLTSRKSNIIHSLFHGPLSHWRGPNHLVHLKWWLAYAVGGDIEKAFLGARSRPLDCTEAGTKDRKQARGSLLTSSPKTNYSNNGRVNSSVWIAFSQLATSGSAEWSQSFMC